MRSGGGSLGVSSSAGRRSAPGAQLSRGIPRGEAGGRGGAERGWPPPIRRAARPRRPLACAPCLDCAAMAPARLLALLLLLVGAPAAAAESVGAWRFPRGWWGGGPPPPLFLGAWKRWRGGASGGCAAPQGDVEAGQTLLETWLRGHGEAPGVAPPRAVRPQLVALPAFPWPQPRRELQART